MGKQFIFLLLFLVKSTFAANVIFDMHGVLVKQFGSVWHIGPSKFFGFFNPIHIEDALFDFLHSLAPLRTGMPPVMHKGRVLPQIMCDFQMDLLSAEQIRAIVADKLNFLAPGIDSQRKVNLLRSIADFIFTPEEFVKCIIPIKQGVKILKKCYRQKDKDGNRLNKVFIISNWDYKSFLLLFDNTTMRFLNWCDGIITSAMCGRMKPDKEIFYFAFNHFGINPDKELTFFIDDEKANIQAARSLNMKFLKCIHCNNFDFAPVDKMLRMIGVYS
jgi:FMN phosphatase YigB (HAD superfamily)